MSSPSEPLFSSRLLPEGWLKAPSTYWRIDAKDAFLFLVYNLALGTCGLWIPVIYALLGDGSPGKVVEELLDGGAVYLFTIPFLASITYVVIDYQHKAQEGGTRKQCGVYLTILMALCIFVSLLISNQVGSDEGGTLRKYIVQSLICVFATVAGTYIVYLLKIDVAQSIPDDIDKGARTLKTDAQAAKSERGDFE